MNNVYESPTIECLGESNVPDTTGVWVVLIVTVIVALVIAVAVTATLTSNTTVNLNVSTNVNITKQNIEPI